MRRAPRTPRGTPRTPRRTAARAAPPHRCEGRIAARPSERGPRQVLGKLNASVSLVSMRDALRDATYGAMRAERFVAAHHLRNEGAFRTAHEAMRKADAWAPKLHPCQPWPSTTSLVQTWKGDPQSAETDPARPGITLEGFPAAGVDGTDGEHPRYTKVVGNLAREVGLYEKQSSFFVQAKTAQSTITGNVFFNGPRAGINANDGFGGGDEIAWNLVFSTCRESGDHGPINSWDRLPFLTDLTGSFSSVPSLTTRNLIFANYGGSQAFDNDDGSSFYHTIGNVFYSSDGFKMDYGGHDSNFSSNVVVVLPSVFVVVEVLVVPPGPVDCEPPATGVGALVGANDGAPVLGCTSVTTCDPSGYVTTRFTLPSAAVVVTVTVPSVPL